MALELLEMACKRKAEDAAEKREFVKIKLSISPRMTLIHT